MSLIPGFKNDLFISYTHIDNDPLIEGKPGWVDFFEDILRKRIRVRIGEEVNIFRDKQLRHSGKFTDQLADQISNSAVFISILSPRYVESEYCRWELEQFCRLGGLNRIIKVVKTAFETNDLEPAAQSVFSQIKDILEYRFYFLDESSKLYRDLQPEVIPGHIPECLEKIDGLTQNVVELIKRLRKGSPSAPVKSPAGGAIGVSGPPSISIPAESPMVAGSSPPPDQGRITVYLAETAKDLAEERNRVKSELIQFNYRVVPDKPLPLDLEELIATARQYMQQSKISIHLFGKNYGTILDGENRSIPHLQYDLAAELGQNSHLKQLIWFPVGVAPEINSDQANLISTVKKRSPDYLQTKLEDLKTEILKTLQPPAPDLWESEEGDNPVNVSLVCQEKDVKSVGPIYSYLTVRELFKVKLPLKDAQSLEQQKQILQSSDAVILYYGAADEDWFVNIWRQIQRLSAANRKKTMLVKAIYAGDPPTTGKDLLQSEDPLILRHYGQFAPQVLAPFVERIHTLRGGGE